MSSIQDSRIRGNLANSANNVRKLEKVDDFCIFS